MLAAEAVFVPQYPQWEPADATLVAEDLHCQKRKVEFHIVFCRVSFHIAGCVATVVLLERSSTVCCTAVSLFCPCMAERSGLHLEISEGPPHLRGAAASSSLRTRAWRRLFPSGLAQ